MTTKPKPNVTRLTSRVPKPSAEPDRDKTLVTTTARAADILTAFLDIDTPSLGVTELANHLKLSKAVVHRLLTTLAVKGFIEADEARRYRLGPTVLRLGAAYQSRIHLRDLIMPKLQELSDLTQETSTFTLRQGWHRIYVDQITPDREVKMSVPIGRLYPLHAGSTSKALLAFLPEVERERFLSEQPLEALSDRTITDPHVLRQELLRIRERGFAVSFGERQPGAGSVAAPVLDHRGTPVAVISICGPIERFREGVDRFSRVLVEATTALSRRLAAPTGRGTRPKAQASR